jgi:hypothetical protein
MHNTEIYFPMLALFVLTVLVALRLILVRAKAMRAREVNPRYFRVFQGEAPEYMVAAGRCYANLLELPILFYVVCLALLATGVRDDLYLILAWAFVVLRVVQAAIHLTYNNPGHRGIVFLLGFVVLAILWIRLGLRLLA